ncbi:hypothetical protein [Aminipila sp.]|uniref:hypothetical protein n=1 Tax=Aminipila sp. TaxID=2060095 RepID=UPI0028A1F36A|nr:hypothetical protein [Aminipila sp.]
MENTVAMILKLIFVICSIILLILFVPAVIEGIRKYIRKEVKWISLIIFILFRMFIITSAELVLWKIFFTR